MTSGGRGYAAAMHALAALGLFAGACGTTAAAEDCTLPRIEGEWKDTGATTDQAVEINITIGNAAASIGPQVTGKFKNSKHRCPKPGATGGPVGFVDDIDATLVFHPDDGSHGAWHIEGKLQVCLFDADKNYTIKTWWTELRRPTVSETELDGQYLDHTKHWRDIALTRKPSQVPAPAKPCRPQ